MRAMEEDSTMNILIASDVHVGYKEKDPERGKDSFTTLKEIFLIAKEKNVDFVLFGGDLFHENKPSRKTLHSTMELFQKYCFGDRPCEVEVVSDQAVNFGHTSRSITSVNYENPNINISMPVFSIHGNHDDPTGTSELSAIDILSVAGLLNHFGKHTQLETIEISPVLLQKGTTKLALYGLGSIRDERLHRLFENGKITYLRPQEDIDDWFNIFVLHQNRIKHGMKNYIPEQFIDEFFDLIVWGHEHECRIDPEHNAIKNFMVMQPGSPVATSLCEAEAQPKHVAVLKLRGREMKIEKIPLRSVRQMYVETITLSQVIRKLPSVEATEKEARKYCKRRVEALLEKASRNRSGHRDQPVKPLIRLRIDYSGGFDIFNSYKFGAEFADRVANPENIVHFLKRSIRKDQDGVDVRDIDTMIGLEEVEKVKMEDLVREYLNSKEKKDHLLLLTAQEISEAVSTFVDKQENDAILAECLSQMEKTTEHILNKDRRSWERSDIINDVCQYREEREKELRTQKSAATDQSSVEAAQILEKAKQRFTSNVSRIDASNESMDVDQISDMSVGNRKRGGRSQSSSRGRGGRSTRGGTRGRNTSSTSRESGTILAFARPVTKHSDVVDLTSEDSAQQTSTDSLWSKNKRSTRTRASRSKGITYDDSDDENPF